MNFLNFDILFVNDIDVKSKNLCRTLLHRVFILTLYPVNVHVPFHNCLINARN